MAALKLAGKVAGEDMPLAQLARMGQLGWRHCWFRATGSHGGMLDP